VFENDAVVAGSKINLNLSLHRYLQQVVFLDVGYSMFNVERCSKQTNKTRPDPLRPLAPSAPFRKKSANIQFSPQKEIHKVKK
jgi:hypothetical protein